MCLPPRLKFHDQQRGIPSSEPRGPSDRYLCPAQGENLPRTLTDCRFPVGPKDANSAGHRGSGPSSHKHPMPETYKSSDHSPAPRGSRKREKMVAARLSQETASRPQCPRHQHSKQQLGLSHTRLGCPGSTWALELVSLSLQTLQEPAYLNHLWLVDRTLLVLKARCFGGPSHSGADLKSGGYPMWGSNFLLLSLCLHRGVGKVSMLGFKARVCPIVSYPLGCGHSVFLWRLGVA